MKFANLSARTRRNLWIAGVAVVLFTITGFFILPPIVKAQLEKRASAMLGRAVTVDKVRLNPYTLSITLENLDVREKGGKASFLGWSRLYVNFDALASLTGDWVLSEIELEGFHAAVAVNRDGSYNFSDVLAKLTAAPAGPAVPAKPSRPIRIGSLKVTQARVDFTDQSRPTPFATVVGPLTFALTEFRTAGARGAPYHFEAVTESGEKLAWTGTLSAEPLRSVGEFDLQNILLAKYSPYYANRIQADLAEGKLSVRGHYEVDLTDGQRALKLADGTLQLRGLKLLDRASREEAVELPGLDIRGIDADALALKATVGSVDLTGGHLRVRREKDGAINLLAMLQPPAGNPAPAAPAVSAAPAKLPDIMIHQVALKDFQVDLTDLAAPRPAQLALGGLQLSLNNVTVADGAAIPLQLSFNWAPKGTVHVEGTISVKPELKADLKTDVVALEILPLSPYLEQFVNAHITQGAVTASLAAQGALPEGKPFAAAATGDVKLEKFGLVDGVHNEDLAGLGSLALSGLRISTAPQLSVTVEEVTVAAPYARVIVNSDKSLNLAAIARPAPKPLTGPVAPATVPAASAPRIEIGKVSISDGEFSFADRSLEPNVRTAITQFGGTISGLSSENMAKGTVALKATVDGAGPVAISGQLDPLGAKKFVDLKVDFRNVDLLPLSPYSGKYAGYELARGKLVVDTKFQLNGDKIDASNVVTLNQFTFGEPVKSPDATSLPVRLGVALLKDLDGKIVIDVPVQGSIDDPAFRIGRVVLRVIVNLLTKAAVSPFSLLGSMFGGGGDELAYQDFAPGATALQPEGVKKLETMVKALTNRPGLSLDLEGSYDAPADTFALKRQKFADAVRRAVWEAKHASDPTIAPPDQLVITPEEDAAMVKKLFDEKFPPGTQFGAPLAKAPVAVAPPPAPKKGFFGRVIDAVTFKGLRNEKSQPAEAAQPVETAAAVTAATGPSLEEMTGRMAETMEVNDNDLRALAQLRAQRVRDYFIAIGKIDPARLFLAKDKSDSTKTGKGPRVFLTLQ